METVFSSPRFDLYRNGEAIQLAHDIVKACNDEGAVALKIETATNEVDAVCTTADEAFGTNAGSTLTEEIIALDQLRDNGIVGIKMVAMGFSKHKDAAKRSAAKLILQSLTKYSSAISKENLPTETTIIRNWYAEVSNNSTLAAALTLFGIKDWADAVNTDNESFNTKYVLRSQQIGNNKNLETVGDILPSLYKKLKRLLHFIDALHTLNTTGAYDDLIAKINGLIKQYNDRAKARRSNGGGKVTPTA